MLTVLCRDAAGQTHALAWGLLKNRASESFRRFFMFLFGHCPTIRTFVCDCHHGQRRAILDVFGDGVHIFHCCIHVARNIASNVGPNTDLASRFWEMRFQRTPESEARFLEALERLHAARHSLFTTQLLRHVNSFLPSQLDPLLKRSKFSSLTRVRSLNFTNYHAENELKRRAFELLQQLANVKEAETDVFAVDNTNSIESHFNVVKRRLSGTNLTLLDVYKAVDFTEMTALSRQNQFAPPLPFQLRKCLCLVISSDIINILSTTGVDWMIGEIVSCCLMLIAGRECPDEVTRMVATSIETGSVITTFSWIPQTWLIPARTSTTTHTVSIVRVNDESDGETILARLEPFLGIAHRSMEVFDEISSALAALHSLRSDSIQNTTIPVNYQFLHREFNRFTTMGQTDGEVMSILKELCSALESLPTMNRTANETSRKESIVDPGVVSVKGRQATNTSARVDRTVKPPSTKTVDKHQASRPCVSSPKKPRRCHTCPVCLKGGHYSKTCCEVLFDQHTQRANAFFRDLIVKNKVQQYVKAMAARVSLEFSQRLAERIGQITLTEVS